MLAWDLSGTGLAPGVTADPATPAHLRFAGAAQAVRPDVVVHAHREDGYAVLRGAAASLSALLAAAGEAFPLILLDAGCNEEGVGVADRALAVADRLVLVTGTEPDDVAAAAARLRAIRGTGHGRALAEGALVVVTSSGRVPMGAVRTALDLLRPLAGGVVALPWDPALRTSAIRSAALDPATARVALGVAAATVAVL